MLELNQLSTFVLVSSALLTETSAEQAGEIARLQAFDQGCLPDPGVTEQFDLDLVDGTGGGYELLDVLLGSSVPLEHAEQVPQGCVALHPGADLGRDSLPVCRVNAGPGQTETPSNLRVAVFGRQVERVLTLRVGDVHVAAEGAERLSQTELAVPGTDVDGGLPLAVQQVEVRPGVKEQQGDMAVVSPQGKMEWS